MELFGLTKIVKKKLYDFIDKQYPRMKESQILQAFQKTGSNHYIAYPWNSINGSEFIKIGDNFHANKGLFLGAYGSTMNSLQINIGNDVVINYDCQITAINYINIGNDVLIGSRVLISDHSHGEISKEALQYTPIQRRLYSKGPIIIGDRVWIGSGVAILPNVTIGNDCIIGANSVVTKSFLEHSLIAGNPAILIRKLN